MRSLILPCVATSLLIFAVAVSATLGGDVSEPFGQGDFHCAHNKLGWERVIVRSYQSFGVPDPNAKDTLAHAKAGGISVRDIYHFPCKGKDAKEQVKADVDNIGKDNFHMLWFDIETNPSPGCSWGAANSDLDSCAFLGDLIKGAKEIGLEGRIGVYSSVYEWGQTVGAGCKEGKDLPLWYANYDGQHDFKDFTPFGGWDKAAMKQYGDHSGGECGISADGDWYPK